MLEHLWLADAIARRFHGRGEDDEDLQQVARCALLEAAHRYDPEQGPFSSFAGPTISGVLKRHFRDHGWVVRPPRQTQQLAVRITRLWSDVAQERGSVPSDHDLADSLGESLSTIRKARHASQGYRTVPFDELSSSFAVAGSTDPEYERCEARLLIHQAWRLLDADERRLLRMRFWEQRSQSGIAAQIGTSQMQVSRLLTRVLSSSATSWRRNRRGPRAVQLSLPPDLTAIDAELSARLVSMRARAVCQRATLGVGDTYLTNP